MEAALQAIAEPRRRQILALIRADELSAGEIAGHFMVTWPAISQHLRVLKAAGLVTERRVGTRRLYRARPEGLKELLTFLEGFWDERLTALKRVAEQVEETSVASVPDGIVVVREVLIEASPETIWRLLIDPAEAVRWMGVAASFDPRAGGRYQVEVLPGDVVTGEFVELDPPHHLVHTWGWESESGSVPPGSTTVAFDLIRREAGTLVRVTHHGLPGAVAAERHARGWDHYLPRLASVAAGARTEVDPWIERPEL
jgi:uncharacterized protein YndB with AHSA1/START domain/DNA-binding transcriptional ArsR family regulator